MRTEELPYGFRRVPAPPPTRRRVWLAQRAVELMMVLAAAALVVAVWSGARDAHGRMEVPVVGAPTAFVVVPFGDADIAPAAPLPVADGIEIVDGEPSGAATLAAPARLVLLARVPEASATRRGLIAGWRHASLVAALVLMWVARRLLARAQSDSAFSASAVRDLRLLAWGTLVLGPASLLAQQLADRWLAGRVDATGIAPVPLRVDMTPLILAVLLLALAELWRVGVEHREAAEGVV